MITWLPQVDSSIVMDSLKSLLLLLSVLIARTLIVRSISRNAALTMEAKRRWVVSVRNSMVFVFLLGLVVIWAHELQAFAVSLVALAAALVLATKELLLCWQRRGTAGRRQSVHGGRSNPDCGPSGRRAGS